MKAREEMPLLRCALGPTGRPFGDGLHSVTASGTDGRKAVITRNWDMAGSTLKKPIRGRKMGVGAVCRGHQTAITTSFVSQTNPTTPLTTGQTVLQSDVPQGFIKPTGRVVPHPKLEAIHHRWSACQDRAILQLVHQGKLLREQPVQGRKAA